MRSVLFILLLSLCQVGLAAQSYNCTFKNASDKKTAKENKNLSLMAEFSKNKVVTQGNTIVKNKVYSDRFLFGIFYTQTKVTWRRTFSSLGSNILLTQYLKIASKREDLKKQRWGDSWIQLICKPVQ